MLVYVHAVEWNGNEEEEWHQDDSGAAVAGEWYRYSGVPYDHMWADDILWMPSLLRDCSHSFNNKDAHYFEGYFLFNGPLGSDVPLIRHQVGVRSPKESKNRDL